MKKNSIYIFFVVELPDDFEVNGMVIRENKFPLFIFEPSAKNKII